MENASTNLKERTKYINYGSVISMNLSPEVLFTQLAEESAELSAAASKMARKLNGSNPTSKYVDEKTCYLAVKEELADVINCIIQLNIPVDWQLVMNKMLRWENRLGWQPMSDKACIDIATGKKQYCALEDGKFYGTGEKQDVPMDGE